MYTHHIHDHVQEVYAYDDVAEADNITTCMYQSRLHASLPFLKDRHTNRNHEFHTSEADALLSHAPSERALRPF